jgi:hypothetical protein
VTEIWALAALWLGLALIATLVSVWLRIATALSEIVVGTIALGMRGESTHLVMPGIIEALELLDNPLRLVASLRI